GIGTTTPGSDNPGNAGTVLSIEPSSGVPTLLMKAAAQGVPQIYFGNVNGFNGGLLFNSGTTGSANDLTFFTGGTFSGNAHLDLDSTGKLSVGAINGIIPLATLDTRAVSGTLPIASFSGQTSFAGLVVDNKGTGDLFTASSSGASRFVITQAGNVGIGTTTPGASLDLSTGTIQGAGLSSDCSSANSILQWSSSTKKFTCATSGSVLVQKSADQSVTSSTTLVNDTDLKTSSLPTNTAVVMHFVIHFQAGTTGQYKFAVTGPAGSSLTGYARGFQAAGSGATGNGCAMVLNTSCTIPNTDTSELAIHIEIVAQTAGTGGAFNFQFAQVASNGTASITRKNSTLVYWILPNAADYAEVYYTKDPTIEAADVVSVDGSLKSGVQKSKGSYDNTTVGIISTNPAYLIGDVGDNTGAPVKLALSGRVPVKVSSINGSIKAGDYLTSSAIPGVAMKATRPGQMIGKALEDYSSNDPTSIGSISVFVNLSWADPSSNSFKNNTALVDHFSQELTGLDVTEESNINDVSILKNISASSSGSLSQTFTDRLVAAFGIVTTSVTADTIYAHTIKADHIEGLDLLNSQVLQLTNKIATLSANNAVLGASTSASQLTIPNNLIATGATGNDPSLFEAEISGLTITNDATVSGKLRVKGSGLFEGILSVIDTLKANDFMATGIAEFFNTAVFHNDVSFEGQPTFNADTAGFAVVKKGSDHIDITFDKPYQAIPVVNATLSVTSTSVTPTPINGKTLEQRLLDAGYSYIVTKQSTKGFTILLNKSATEDVQFSWSALSIKDAKIFQSGGLTPTPTITLTPIPNDSLLNPEASGSAN
ncbi:MAG TPA: hypothetical protein VLG67_04415, partial [Candidatus Saccharimonadales bacterium]|nr:hypothetical protein [Candidatus Saccharimonadales bacterium]